MTSNSDGILDLASSDALRSDEVGSKAATLAKLASAGHTVPPGLVVLPQAATLPAAELVVERFGHRPLAVRSSALAEDLASASFAGQYETVLGVREAAEVANAIEKVRASAGAASQRGYSDDGDETMPVLIMPLVDAKCAGVMFTADPVTGDRVTVIEAVAGLGDKLVSGLTTPQRWKLGERVSSGDDEPDLLTADQVEALSVMGRRIAEEMGSPQDIEWAIHEDEIWVLQARPITALPQRPQDYKPGEHEIWQQDPAFTGPVRPSEFSAWAPVFERTTRSVFEEVGAPIEALTYRRIGGWLYSRAIPPMDNGKDDMKTPPALIFGLLMRVVPAFRRRLARAAKMWESDLVEEAVEEWEQGGRDRLRAGARKLRQKPLTGMSRQQLADHLDAVLEQLQRGSDVHFRLPVLATFLPMGRLGVIAERDLGWRPEQTAVLLQGFSADRSRSDAIDLLAATVSEDGEINQQALQSFLDEHGHQSIGVDLSLPTWAEDPSPLLALLRPRSAAASTIAEVDVAAAAVEQEAEARRQLSGEALPEFETALRTARRGAGYGDETETDVLEAFALLRYCLLEIGRRLAEDGYLDHRDDVLQLTLDETRAILRGDRPDVDVALRKAEYAWSQAHPGPPRYGPPPPPWPSMRHTPKRARPFLESMVWVMTHLEGENTTSDGEGSDLRGIAASPGRASGPARLIRDPSEFNRIHPGDILVCPATIAAWSVVFPTISAIVTERGGPLSHPGILAREYGIPAVLSLPQATSIFCDGEEITVDGTRGVVTRKGEK